MNSGSDSWGLLWDFDCEFGQSRFVKSQTKIVSKQEFDF